MPSYYPPEETTASEQSSPPPLREYAPPPRKRRGCGIWILAAVAVFFFLCTVLLFLALMGTVMVTTGLTTVEGELMEEPFVVATVEGSGPNKILMIPINGVIADIPYKTFTRSERGLVSTVSRILKQARTDPEIRAIILSIDSPGGGITASDVLYHQLNEFHNETGIPIVALLGDVAASGGYYVAATADYIVAHPTTITGSIGVVMPWFNAQGLLQKIGIESRPIKSGEKKDLGSITRGMSEEERALLQSIVNEYYERFVKLVHEGFKRRGIERPFADLKTACDGRVFTGEQAKQLGFVDEIGYFEDAVNAACKTAGISAANSRVIIYQRKPGLLEMVLSKSSAPGTTTLTLDIETLREATTPRFQYLWTVGEETPSLEE